MKRLTLFLVFIILLSAISSAQGMSLYDNSYVSGETVQAMLEYDGFDISKLSLLDESGNEVTSAFFSVEINSTYHVYFNLAVGLAEGNYTFQLKDRKLVEDEWTDIVIEESFNVVPGNSSFSISPGFVKISADESSLKIKLQHRKGGAIEIEASSESVDLVRDTITLNPGESKFLFADYSFEDVPEDAMILLSFDSGSYDMPILKEAIKEAPAENVTEEPEPVVENETVEHDFTGALSIVNDDAKSVADTVSQDVTIEGFVRIMNLDSLPLHNVRFVPDESLSGIVEFNVSSFDVLEPGIVYEQYVWINRDKNVEPGKYEGIIMIISEEGASESMDINLVFSSIETEPEEQERLNITDYTPGNISINFSELGQEPEEDQGKSLAIAIILIVIVLILIGILAYRLRPKKGMKQLGSYAKGLKK